MIWLIRLIYTKDKQFLYCDTKYHCLSKDSSIKKGEMIMYELVELKKDEIFTNSKIIAEGTNNKHSSIQRIISKYEKRFSEFGQVRFEIRPVKYSRGTNEEKVYLLNEEQAMFLMVLLRNDGVDGIVVAFKSRLVSEFIKMRRFIQEKQSKVWIEMRENNKQNRLKETDVIQQLVEYAKEQGSQHPDKLYMVYTKLAKTIIGGDRDNISIFDLSTLTLVESVILQTIRIDMSMGMHYKDIYKDCKKRIEQFADIAYLSA